jgi:pyruvate kinase
MTENGMDVARLNLSHNDFEFHRSIYKTLHNIGTVATLVDLPGPKIRVGRVGGSISLKPGEKIHLTTLPILGSQKELPISYENLPREVDVGGSVFINDGLIEVRILSIDGDMKGFTGEIVTGGVVVSHKGINAPGAKLSPRPPTNKDLKGIKFGIDFCDWFAISFVRSRQDVENTIQAIKDAGGDQPVISKIEHQDAIRNIIEIVDASDGIMVARGDLGIEVQPWEVPLLQKRIINICNNAGKPVIVATQMLESMVVNPRPTRAEASDIANAILDGSDAVMLSEETAVGLYPVEAVRVMNNISRTVEQQSTYPMDYQKVEGPIQDIIGDIASRAASTLKPAAIIVVTRSGFSARMVSKHRPAAPILSVSKSSKVNMRNRLYWGVIPLEVPWTDDRNELLVRSVMKGIEADYLDKSDVVMIVSGSTLEAPGRTSTLEVLNVADVISYSSRKR